MEVKKLNNTNKLREPKSIIGMFMISLLLLVIITTLTLASGTINAAEEEGSIGTVEDITQDGGDVYVNLSTGEGIKLTFL
ncbi:MULTISPECIES: hypothetical protein, partial [unclassified Oceanobacillus]|uniref:hypothetical protein n=1 Tax=unclassified Oceanobacillus TaxID=2630292 RepID=UPI00300E3F70